MKKFKFSIFGLLFVLVAAVGFSAFTGTPTDKDPVFYYVLDFGGDPLDETDYGDPQSEPPAVCGGDDEVCWIAAEDNSGLPDITMALAEEIELALDDHDDTDNVKLKN